MELGRDSDTGGQVKYVVELARALANTKGVDRVDLLTRQITSPEVDSSYGEPIEMLSCPSHATGSCGAYIIRIPSGPRDKYIAKESLWPHIPEFVDGALNHIVNMGRALGDQLNGGKPTWPYVIHGHYADAGEVAAHLSGALNVPMVLTGHSLGRNKFEQLLKQGRLSKEAINATYKIMRRIEGEELGLDAAEMVVTSTMQEIEEQWGLYGFDLKLERKLRVRRRRGITILALMQIMRFFTNPHKPTILALSRPDPKKNVTTLLKAFGECQLLRELANLTLILGNRDDIEDMSNSSSVVLTTVLKLIDRFDLYGQVAYPKHHKQSEVPEIYRLAAKTKGVSSTQLLWNHLVLHSLRQQLMAYLLLPPNGGTSGLEDFDALVCNSGSEMYYPWKDMVADTDYEAHMAYRWPGENVRSMAMRLARTEDGAEDDITEYVAACSSRCYSYSIKPGAKTRRIDDLRQRLRMRGFRCNLVYTRAASRLNVVPLFASRIQALRYLSIRWAIDVSKVVLFVGEKGDTDYEDLLVAYTRPLF
ncbi:hypothetical protein ES288_A05G267300v1 [Gossypium darwinii]|uniref:Sucrose synthase domain-containing protein n=1 Tax=Gossypium darwinii TaxID=34276 RepID=A0A5D2GJT5_GOSDA|nr:hypothetical protein ES288_A05G267300v1 [Gossypium darwinii]